MDPCLFVITRKYIGKQEFLFMLAHVDDFDMAGSTQQIVEEVKAECKVIWDITDVDPEFMLGIRRRAHTDEDGKIVSMELDMMAFVEGMAEAFKDHLPVKALEPVPHKFELSKSTEVTDAESAAVIKAGYQAAVGMLLWAARHVHPPCRLGVSMCCRVMSRPSWEAFGAAMQMIKWMYDNRTQGIKFTSGVNTIPVGLSDASNKKDRADSKCQYSAVFMLAGGPIISVSKKLGHIGCSSGHNEYMALFHAHQLLVWLRQLLDEMGMHHMTEIPTVIYADNTAANKLTQEDIVTSGNQFILMQYHYSKEVQKEGHSVVEYINSARNISDLGTKAVDRSTYKTLVGPLTGYDTRLLEQLISELKQKKLYPSTMK